MQVVFRNLFLLGTVLFLFMSCGADRHLNILFIGNSYTYRNEMPRIFEQMALAKGKSVYVERVTKGKATFQIQANRKEVFQTIQTRKWDYVILQGSSRDMLAEDSILQHQTVPSVKKIVQAIHQNERKTKVLFYMTWGYKDGFKEHPKATSYEKMSLTVKNGYLNFMKKFRFGVVPVGMAWFYIRKKRPDVNLYVKDGGHPSYKGSYLAASCFYAAIFNESPVGAKYYGVLGPKICYFLQKAAARQVLPHREKYGLK